MERDQGAEAGSHEFVPGHGAAAAQPLQATGRAGDEDRPEHAAPSQSGYHQYWS